MVDRLLVEERSSRWSTGGARAASLLLLLALAGGCHAGAGPVFGYAFGRGGTVGWEASGGRDPLLRGSVGQSFRAEEEVELMPPPPARDDWPLAAQGTPALDEVVPPPPEELLDAPGGPTADDEEEEEEEEDEDAPRGPVELGPIGAERRREFATYLAFEPGFFGGATVGMGVGSADWEPGMVLGLWGGAPAPIGLFTVNPTGSEATGYVTLAIGYRYLAGAHELYVTPKVGIALLPRL